MRELFGFALGLMLQTQVAVAHDIYTNWKSPVTGRSCCNTQDCQTVDWRINNKGQLELEVENGRWIVPPKELEMKNVQDPQGRAHWCGRINRLETDTFCYLPPVGSS
jgi:hypothetical protein